MSSGSAQILPQGAGYGVVVGVGFFFAAGKNVRYAKSDACTDVISYDGHFVPSKSVYKVLHQD